MKESKFIKKRERILTPNKSLNRKSVKLSNNIRLKQNRQFTTNSQRNTPMHHIFTDGGRLQIVK